jgi:hypothetical protein
MKPVYYTSDVGRNCSVCRLCVSMLCVKESDPLERLNVNVHVVCDDFMYRCTCQGCEAKNTLKVKRSRCVRQVRKL